MSAVLEHEVSEGYPVDGKVFEPPQQSRENEEPRYVTILGSFIVPDGAMERPWTRAGGIEVASPCLRYVKNFIRKGRITPVLKDTHHWISVDLWEKATGKDRSFFERQIPAGYVAPLNEYGNQSKVTPMMGKMALPGEQIDSIVNGSANVFKRSRRGVVELKTLKGQPYNPTSLGNGIVTDANIWEIQRAIFPTYPILPILLDEIEQLLDAATEHTYIRAIVDEMQTSLNQFRDHARGTVEQTHYTMRESAQKSEAGYIPRYTDLDFVLLEQLGMGRQDITIRKETPAAPAPNTKLEGMFEQWLALQIEEKQAIAAERAAQATDIPAASPAASPAGDISTPAVDANTMVASPIAEPRLAKDDPVLMGNIENGLKAMNQAILAEKAVHVCECGKEYPTPQGLNLHRSVHCELRQKEETPAEG